ALCFFTAQQSRKAKARPAGKFSSNVTGAVTANAAGYRTPTSHDKFAKIRTWLFKANVSGSIKSSTLRPQMLKVILFQHPAKADISLAASEVRFARYNASAFCARIYGTASTAPVARNQSCPAMINL